MAAIAVLAFFSIGVEIAIVPTPSMEPTIMVGDHLLINKALYGPRIPFTHMRLPALRRVRRGEIVSVQVPEHTRYVLVKRVVAVSGDEVEMRNGTVYVNHFPLTEHYAKDDHPESFTPMIVPAGAVFLLGDNRSDSEDSRVFGPVPAANVIGEPILICWSLAIPWSEWLDREGSLRLQAYSEFLRDFAKLRWNRTGRFLE